MNRRVLPGLACSNWTGPFSGREEGLWGGGNELGPPLMAFRGRRRRGEEGESGWSSGQNRVEPLWPKIILKKWLNTGSNESDFSADDSVDTTDSEFEFQYEEMCEWERQLRDKEWKIENCKEGIPWRLRRRKSETLRAQYITTKELRICVGTWNVGGKLPPDDFDITEWLDTEEPADIYVLGLQEIVPLNAGNVFGAEDNRRVPRWESLIREALNRFQPKAKYKCYSDPPSPSRFKPSDDALVIEDEILSGLDSDNDDETQPGDEQFFNFHTYNDAHTRTGDDLKCNLASDCNLTTDVGTQPELNPNKKFTMKKSDRPPRLSFKAYELDSEATITRLKKLTKTNLEASIPQHKKLTRTLSASAKIGLIWPEQPLDIVAQEALLDKSTFSRSRTSSGASNWFKSGPEGSNDSVKPRLIPELILDIVSRKRRPPFVKIISKQMVGIYLSIWVRRSLRMHIQNLKVSTVGVGAMGYIGNKGSISVSMSIYQTLFCFICTHLTSGENECDNLRRNADVHGIHRRTVFSSAPGGRLFKTILDHERIIWLGDLNYRINLPYEKTHKLVAEKEWSELIERDQLKQELKKGRAFDGWSEGIIKFPPTYKYERNSGKYIGEDAKTGRRTPAWCDRILSYGNSMNLLDYRRVELKLSDHRPVTAIYMAEVEIISHRKLQKALTFTDAELEDINFETSHHLRPGEGAYCGN